MISALEESAFYILVWVSEKTLYQFQKESALISRLEGWKSRSRSFCLENWNVLLTLNADWWQTPLVRVIRNCAYIQVRKKPKSFQKWSSTKLKLGSFDDNFFTFLSICRPRFSALVDEHVGLGLASGFRQILGVGLEAWTTSQSRKVMTSSSTASLATVGEEMKTRTFDDFSKFFGWVEFLFTFNSSLNQSLDGNGTVLAEKKESSNIEFQFYTSILLDRQKFDLRWRILVHNARSCCRFLLRTK